MRIGDVLVDEVLFDSDKHLLSRDTGDQERFLGPEGKAGRRRNEKPDQFPVCYTRGSAMKIFADAKDLTEPGLSGELLVKTQAVAATGATFDFPEKAVTLSGGRGSHLPFTEPRDPQTQEAQKLPHTLAIYDPQSQNSSRFNPLRLRWQYSQNGDSRWRDTALLVRLSAHDPALLEASEEKGWDVDYYMCSLYYLSRSREQWQQLLGTDLPLGEIHLPSDALIVDMTTQFSDQVAENTACARKILAKG